MTLQNQYRKNKISHKENSMPYDNSSVKTSTWTFPYCVILHKVTKKMLKALFGKLLTYRYLI